jgi:hypothetical protein
MKTDEKVYTKFEQSFDSYVSNTDIVLNSRYGTFDRKTLDISPLQKNYLINRTAENNAKAQSTEESQY